MQFTRNPAGLSSALKKIGGYVHGSRLMTPQAEEAGLVSSATEWAKRGSICWRRTRRCATAFRAIDPSFDGKFPVVLSQVAQTRQQVAAKAGINVTTQLVNEITGQPPRKCAPNVLKHARSFLSSHGDTKAPGVCGQLSFDAAGVSHSRVAQSTSAAAVVFSLILSRDRKIEEQQRASITEIFGNESEERTLEMQAFIAPQDPSEKLPLLMLAVSACVNCPPRTTSGSIRCVRTLVETDSEIDLFEYTVTKALMRHLEPQFQRGDRSITQFYSIKPLLPDCSVLLSALAHSGHVEGADAAKAFAAGIPHLRHGVTGLRMLQRLIAGSVRSMKPLRLAQAVPQIKRTCSMRVPTVAADGVIHANEAELLRAIATRSTARSRHFSRAFDFDRCESGPARSTEDRRRHAIARPAPRLRKAAVHVKAIAQSQWFVAHHRARRIVRQ